MSIDFYSEIFLDYAEKYFHNIVYDLKNAKFDEKKYLKNLGFAISSYEPILDQIKIEDLLELSQGYESKSNYECPILIHSYLLFYTNNDIWLLGIANCFYLLKYKDICNNILDYLDFTNESDWHFLEFQLRRFLENNNLEKIYYYLELCIQADIVYERINYHSEIVFSKMSIYEARKIYEKYWSSLSIENDIHLRSFLYMGYYNKARTFLLMNIAKLKEKSEFYTTYIKILNKLGETKKALQFAALNDQNNLAEYYNVLGMCAEEAGDLNMAFFYYEKSLDYAYTYTASVNIVRWCISYGNFERAKYILNSITQNNDNYEPLSYFYWSRLCFFTGQAADAVRFINKTLSYASIKKTDLWLFSVFFKIIYCAHAGNLSKSYFLAISFLKKFKMYSADNSERLITLKQTILVLFNLKTKISPRLSDFSDVKLTKNLIETRLKNSQFIIDSIKNNKNWSFIVNFQTGDAYLFLGLIKRFREKNDGCIEIYYPKRLRFICMLFKDQVDSFHEINDEIDNWTLHAQFNSFKPGVPLLAHPHFLCRYANGTSRNDNEDRDFITRLEVGLGLDVLSKKKLGCPLITISEENNLSKLNNINKGILIVPSSNSFRNLKLSFWNSLSEKFLEQGYTVYENIGPEGGIGIHGAIPLRLDHDLIILACSKIGRVVGLRSGFFDVISSLPINLDIIYPSPSLSNSWVKNWQINSFANSKVLREHIILYEKLDYDDYKELIKNITA